MRMTTADELMRMMGRFRGNVDFSDSPSGFFGFVRDAFEQLAKEEEYAADYEDVDIPAYPTFGHKDDQYDDVVRHFYAIWSGFATAKSFAWLERYRLSDAPDRRTRRLMEKENQKLRDDGRRDFNAAVQALVAFVRKRDPRYTPLIRSDEDNAKAQRDARKAQAARARAAQLAKLEQEEQAVPTWATVRPPDELEEESEEEIEQEHYECVACNKTFKSERQYETHEKSKKHQKAIHALRKKMQKDNAHLNLDEDVISSGFVTPAESQGVMEASKPDTDETEQPHESDDPMDQLVQETKKVTLDNDDAHRSDPPLSPATKASQDSDTGDQVHGADSENDDDDEYASRSDVKARLAGFDLKSLPTFTKACDDATTKSTVPTSLPASSPNLPKLGKAAQKRAKKAAKQAHIGQYDAKHKCQGCDAAFASRNQLYQHLEAYAEHAMLKTRISKKEKKG
ncbi:hypothetical protein NX059_003466 [Plenodomus lindquistii]|nr:hypothetical protein NX059_003466 [Plenodomus lindquistii]